MQSQQKQVLARLKGPFDVVPQLVYSKTIAKSDKKPSRHFIRSEAFVNEKVIYRKGPSNRANKVLEVSLWVSYIFGLKQNFEERECWVQKFYLRWFQKTREKQKLDFFLNEKHSLWFQDCSMSGFPKGFRISKVRLVNVF